MLRGSGWHAETVEKRASLFVSGRNPPALLACIQVMSPSTPASLPSKIASTLLAPRAADPARATLLLRVAFGGAFFASGWIKILFENQGPGRFAKIGFSHPEGLAYFVSSVEIVCGALLVLGLFARIAALPLIVDMLVAIATTKAPILWGAPPEAIGAPPKLGFWAFAYQARLDVVLLLGCAYVVAAGAGELSLDALFARRRARRSDPGQAAEGAARRHLIA